MPFDELCNVVHREAWIIAGKVVADYFDVHQDAERECLAAVGKKDMAVPAEHHVLAIREALRDAFGPSDRKLLH